MSDESCSVFSTKRFVEAVARSAPTTTRAVEISVPEVTSIWGIEESPRFGSVRLKFGPWGLYAHPFIKGDLDQAVTLLLGKMRSLRVRSIDWHVRYDHALLASALARCGLTTTRQQTQLLVLKQGYESTAGGFHATIRHKLRRIQKSGLNVSVVTDLKDVDEYYELYQTAVAENGSYSLVYPVELFRVLIAMHEDVIFIIARESDRIVAGGWFFRDGKSMLYWAGAMDRGASASFPSCAVLDYAIRMACQEKMETFDFGASLGIASLQRFKSSFGATFFDVWRMRWRNPLWVAMSSAAGRFRFLTHT